MSFGEFVAKNTAWGLEVNQDASLVAAFQNSATTLTQLDVSPIVNQGPVGELNTLYIDNVHFY